MNTSDARIHMRQLAEEGLRLVENVNKDGPNYEARARLRTLASDARDALVDAGFPGEAAWRALQRASLAVETLSGEYDSQFWEALESDLQDAISSLDNLLGPGLGRETDMRIIG